MGSKLRGLNILVTGAASGIGRQLALDLCLREGCNLRLVDRDGAGLDSLKQELEMACGQSRSLVTHVADVGSSSELAALAEEIDDRPLDVVITCAGIFYSGEFSSMSIEDFERIIDVNLLGTARVINLFLPKLFDSPNAQIVTISSLAGLMGAPGMVAYSTSKFGLNGLFESLRMELAGRVNLCLVCPSFVRTSIAANAMIPATVSREESESRREAMARFLARRGVSPEKVSRQVIRALKKRRTLLVINPEAHVLYYLNRFIPRLREKLVGVAYRRLKKGKVISE